MRLRNALANVQQYSRNAGDGLAWLNQIDAALSTVTDQVSRARDIALQGANLGVMGQPARDALASEVDQIREGLIATANTTYLERPIFGGVTAGNQAYDGTGTYVGNAVDVNRTVADGVRVRVDVDGPTAFGPDGDNLFDHLAALSTALRAGDNVGIGQAITDLSADSSRVSTAHAEMGTRQARVEAALQGAQDRELGLTQQLSDVENVDLPRTIVDLQMQQVAYQAALGATSKVMQPSLLDFLR